MIFTVVDQTETLAHVRTQISRGFRVMDRRSWDSAWRENLEAEPSANALIPHYMVTKIGGIKRYEGQYVRCAEPMQEFKWLRQVRERVMADLLAPYGTIYEFGCGSCQNLEAFRMAWPEKTLFGLDWSPVAVELAEATVGRGRLFDFTAPTGSIEPGSAVFTMHALEQVRDPAPFIEWLRLQRPGIVVHVEPIAEWLNETPFDAAMTEYIDARNWLRGLPRAIVGRGEIVETQRNLFGSLFVESYNVLAWRP